MLGRARSDLVSALDDVGRIVSVDAALDVLWLSAEAGLDLARDLAQVGAQGKQVVGTGVERNLSVVDAPLREGPGHVVGKQAIGVARKGDDLDLAAVLVVDQAIRRACLVC